MQHYDWSQFTKRIDINASLKDIFNAWSTQAGLEKWFLRTASFLTEEGKKRGKSDHVQQGDQYKWLWYGYSDDTAENGKVLDTNQVDTIQFSFAGDCIVTVTIKKEGGTHIVELTQSEIPTTDEAKAKYHLDCMAGWTFYLANLKSILESGPDLRNKNESLKGMLNS
ncbi:hypothetical protein COR50_05290 [Chitinophaga caeni]|uniref:Activator of Hsp90 ATPase homologue 1/2-like C-terminal domain-containing protein n=1 Tax=Chitinophaga caeni TaxID=2029983 RepID=A0A291QS28_9BACT|nr:SRPBCC domain-containing protein [Chitinophaga caeni]ATL46644.1 hypothetical protein COR50_05290 [Chitinophaga caeni]